MKNSVIISVYNVEKYLEQCVSSVLQQPESDDIEVILVDDGSTDGSGKLCDALAKKDSRIVCVYQKTEDNHPPEMKVWTSQRVNMFFFFRFR